MKIRLRYPLAAIGLALVVAACVPEKSKFNPPRPIINDDGIETAIVSRVALKKGADMYRVTYADGSECHLVFVDKEVLPQTKCDWAFQVAQR